MKKKTEHFSSRWALLLVTIGMAIGAGNIWRFPRLAGQYGGAFLIPWIIFLITWSIPLLMVEFALGKHVRKGPIGAFATYLGKSYTWMGGFVSLCTMGIMFYYSVVTGWALKYLTAALYSNMTNLNYEEYWQTFTTASVQPVLFHFLALGIAAFIILNGLSNGIERANRILLPSLLVLLLVGVFRSLTLHNAVEGLNYFFGFQNASLFDIQMWLEALSQSAWSTGAGWGLALSYAVYLRPKDDVTLNSFITGFGNNSASLLAGLAIVPAVFSLSASSGDALKALGSGNTGLSFIVLPQLFQQLPGASILVTLFFLGLFFAALTSLIAMLELATRVFIDFGISRKPAVAIVAAITALLGIPSAFSIDTFNNQDWVWGLGLIVSGLFFAFAAFKKGVDNFRRNLLNDPANDLRIGKWFNWVIRIVIPLEGMAILIWWSYRSITQFDPQGWWHPFRPFSVGSCIFQWGLLLLILLLFNKPLYRWLHKQTQTD